MDLTASHPIIHWIGLSLYPTCHWRDLQLFLTRHWWTLTTPWRSLVGGVVFSPPFLLGGWHSIHVLQEKGVLFLFPHWSYTPRLPSFLYFDWRLWLDRYSTHLEERFGQGVSLANPAAHHSFDIKIDCSECCWPALRQWEAAVTKLCGANINRPP